jgi:hypothetical protein
VLILSEYVIQLAREIIESKDTVIIDYTDIQSGDKEFLHYKDNFIEIIAGKNTKSLHIEIYNPLTRDSNPITYVDDNGKCYRNHGESIYFVLYAERLLNKEITVTLNYLDKDMEEKINSLF